MTGTIPYTHWAYFSDEEAARECAADLGRCGFYHNVRHSRMSPEWLLRASREVKIDDLPDRHAMVQLVVESHGGDYDGGEATISLASGEYERDHLTDSDGDTWTAPAREAG